MNLDIARILQRYIAEEGSTAETLQIPVFHMLVDMITAHLVKGDYTVNDYVQALCLAQIKAYDRQIDQMIRETRHASAPLA